MDFSDALQSLKSGRRLRRKGWAGAGIFVVLMPALRLPPYSTSDTARKVNDRTARWIGPDTPLDCQPYLTLGRSDGFWQPGWVPSQEDLLAEDWLIIED